MGHLSSFHIAPVELSRLEEAARLVNSAYRGDESRYGWTTEADLLGGQRTAPSHLQKALTPPPTRCLLGLSEKAGDALLGCVMIEKVDGPQGVGGYLGMLTVNPRLQDRGLGKILLTAAEEFARTTWQASTMSLSVIQVRETLIAWYERRGYRKTGETRPFPFHEVGVGVPVREDIHLVMFEKSLAE